MRTNEVTGLYLSIGIFSDTCCIRGRTIGPRLTGISIFHDNGSIDVLGQWDETEDSSISDIYTNNSGVLTSVTFLIIGESRASYISRLFVGLDHSDPVADLDGTFKTFSVHKPISWWFSERYDHVEPWHGEYKEINLSTHDCTIMKIA